MGKKPKPAKTGRPEPVAVVSVLAEGDSFGLDIQSHLHPETLAAILRTAADQLEGKEDRASGMWGHGR